MSELDVAAIRARSRNYAAFRREAELLAKDPEWKCAAADAEGYADALADELARTDVPALLDALAARDARVAELEQARAWDHHRWSEDQLARGHAEDDAEQLRTRVAALESERDAAIVRGDELEADVTDARAEAKADRIALASILGAVENIAELWDHLDDPRHMLRLVVRNHGGEQAHPPVDEYRVEFHEPADADLPCRGWGFLGAYEPTAEQAVEEMRRRRQMRPGRSPLRVVRIRKTYTVVAAEPPASAEKPSACPPDAASPPGSGGSTPDAL